MFVPRLQRNIAGFAVVQRGETLADLCRRFGRPASDYPELVGANLHRELHREGPEGYSAVLAGLTEGDQINIPQGWVGHAQRSDVHGPRGTLRDEVSDAIAFAYPYAQNIPLPYYKNTLALLSAWWRQGHPGSVPTKDQIAPFGGPALQWMEIVGKNLPLSTVEKIPWGGLPGGFLYKLGAQGFPWSKVNVDKINETLAKNIPLGTVQHGKTVSDWSKAVFDAGTLQKAGLHVPAAWETVAGLRWDLLPDQSIDPTSYKVGTDPNAWLTEKILAYVGQQGSASQDTMPLPGDLPPGVDIVSCGLGKVKIGGQCYGLVAPTAQGCPAGSQGYGPLCIVSPCGAGQQMQIDATGIACIGQGGVTKPDGEGPTCPKGAEQVNKSCNCLPLGPRFVYDPIRNECVDCGPNASFNANDGQCFCNPGYQQASDMPGTGCVKIGGDAPPPPPDKKNQTEAPSNTTAKAIVGAGVVLALLAVILRIKK